MILKQMSRNRTKQQKAKKTSGKQKKTMKNQRKPKENQYIQKKKKKKKNIKKKNIFKKKKKKKRKKTKKKKTCRTLTMMYRSGKLNSVKSSASGWSGLSPRHVAVSVAKLLTRRTDVLSVIRPPDGTGVTAIA